MSPLQLAIATTAFIHLFGVELFLLGLWDCKHPVTLSGLAAFWWLGAIVNGAKDAAKKSTPKEPSHAR